MSQVIMNKQLDKIWRILAEAQEHAEKIDDNGVLSDKIQGVKDYIAYHMIKKEE